MYYHILSINWYLCIFLGFLVRIRLGPLLNNYGGQVLFYNNNLHRIKNIKVITKFPHWSCQPPPTMSKNRAMTKKILSKHFFRSNSEQVSEKNISEKIFLSTLGPLLHFVMSLNQRLCNMNYCLKKCSKQKAKITVLCISWF